MSRFTWLVIGVAVAVFAGVWYVASGPEVPAESAGVIPGAVAGENLPAADAAPTSAPVPPPEPAVTASPEEIARWVADANSMDASKRAAAIKALSGAPREQALPVLKNILESGDPATDRPLALESLRELALKQADGDGQVRNVIREAIYHGDDQTFVASAQQALDAVEQSQLR